MKLFFFGPIRKQNDDSLKQLRSAVGVTVKPQIKNSKYIKISQNAINLYNSNICLRLYLPSIQSVNKSSLRPDDMPRHISATETFSIHSAVSFHRLALEI